MRRRYPKHPLLGVGALIFRRGRVLMCKRAGNPLKGWWSLPGGLVETGETLDTAIRREVLEETGLVVKRATYYEMFERIMRDAEGRAEYHYVLADFICTVAPGEPKAGDDAGECSWIKPADLGGYQVTAGTVDVIQRAAAMLVGSR